MNRKIIAIITAAVMTAAVFTACTDKKPDETNESVSEVAASASETEQTESAVMETTAESSSEDSDGIPQPGDTYNGHTVDHTEDQPDCDDSSHGTVWIFYTDVDTIDYIEY